MATESIAERRAGERATRQSRGLELFREGAFERISRDPETWIVETSYGSANEVEIDRRRCSCKDFEYHWHIDGFQCKHLVAARMYRAWLRKSARALAPVFVDTRAAS